MTLLLLRHVHAGDRSAWTGDDRQRPASPRGRAQAAALAEHLAPVLAGRPLLAAWSSPLRRCVESVVPLAAATGVQVEEHDELAEGTPHDVVDGLLRQAARTAADGGGAVLLCSHGDVIGDTVVTWQQQGYLGDLEARWAKASTWIVDDLLGQPQPRYLPPPDR